MFRLGPLELGLVLLIVFFLFGAKRLPEMGKGIGEGIKNFKKSIKGDDSSDKEKQEKHA
jgi:sec-independent protein translocase protein TatA